MTVSRTLRNEPYVQAKVRQRVWLAAKALGYQPDPALSKMMQHIRGRKMPRSVGTLIALSTVPAHLEPQSMRRVRESASLRAAELGYNLELVRLDSIDQPNPALERSWLARGVDGVLLLQMFRPSDVASLLNWQKFPVVAATASILSPNFATVSVNYYHNARKLCAALTGRGFRRIGSVCPRTFGIRSNDAFIVAAAWEALACDELPVKAFVFDGREFDQRKLRAWLRREKPDAIIAHDEPMATLLRQQPGLNPSSLPPIFCTSIDPQTSMHSGIDERLEILGYKGVDVLAGMIYRHEKHQGNSQSKVLVEGQWFDPP